MSNSNFPQWVLKLLSADGEPYPLSRDDFEKLDAFIPQGLSRRIPLSQFANAQGLDRYDIVKGQLSILHKYNQNRHAAPEIDHDEPPKDVEQALKKGYIESKVITSLFPDRFSSASALTKYLDHPDRRVRIRTFKPKGNRRMVHAADFLQVSFGEYEAEQKAALKRHGEKPPRRNKTRK